MSSEGTESLALVKPDNRHAVCRNVTSFIRQGRMRRKAAGVIMVRWRCLLIR